MLKPPTQRAAASRRPALLRRRRARSGVAAATRGWEGVRERRGAEGRWQRGAPRIFSLLSGSPLSCLSFPLSFSAEHRLRSCSFFRALPLCFIYIYRILYSRASSYFIPRKIIHIAPRSPCGRRRLRGPPRAPFARDSALILRYRPYPLPQLPFSRNLISG